VFVSSCWWLQHQSAWSQVIQGLCWNVYVSCFWHLYLYKFCCVKLIDIQIEIVVVFSFWIICTVAIMIKYFLICAMLTSDVWCIATVSEIIEADGSHATSYSGRIMSPWNKLRTACTGDLSQGALLSYWRKGYSNRQLCSLPFRVYIVIQVSLAWCNVHLFGDVWWWWWWWWTN